MRVDTGACNNTGRGLASACAVARKESSRGAISITPWRSRGAPQARNRQARLPTSGTDGWSRWARGRRRHRVVGADWQPVPRGVLSLESLVEKTDSKQVAERQPNFRESFAFTKNWPLADTRALYPPAFWGPYPIQETQKNGRCCIFVLYFKVNRATLPPGGVDSVRRLQVDGVRKASPEVPELIHEGWQ